MLKVYLMMERYRGVEPEINVFANLEQAIEAASGKLNQMSNSKSRIKVYDVTGYQYFGLNLAEGILVTVEDRNIVFSTSSGYALNVPLSEADFVGR